MRRRTQALLAACAVAPLALVALPAQAATTFTQNAFSVTVNGSSASLVSNIGANPTTTVNDAKFCTRDAGGAVVDYTAPVGTTVPNTGITIRRTTVALPAGAYTSVPCVRVASSGSYTEVGARKSFTVAGSTPSPSPTPSPTVTPTPSPTPSDTPTPTPSPSAPAGACVGAANTPGGADPWGGCWPGPQNTGYPHGLAGDSRSPVTLTNYTGPTTIRSCGVVIDSKIVPQDLLIQAGNGSKSKDTPCVTIKNSLVKGVIYSEEGTYGPTVVTDTEVIPDGLSWWENIGRTNIFVSRVNSHGSQGVIKCEQNCEAVDNWVHGMELGGNYHYNALGSNGMSSGSFLIRHNWASCGDWASGTDADAGCSAAIGFYGDFDPIQNITIDRNFMVGTNNVGNKISTNIDKQAAFCLNPGYYQGKPNPAPLNEKVTDNIFGRGDSGKCGVFGPTNDLNKVGDTRGNTWSGNKFEDGTPVPRPEFQ